MVGNFSHVNEELNERYEGDAEKLQKLIHHRFTTKDDLVAAVNEMLECGCFCPSCMLSYLEWEE